MTRVVLLGSTGFVGSAVASDLRAAGLDVVEVSAPRLSTAARGIDALRATVDEHVDDPALAAIDDCDVVVNAAGLATPGQDETDGLVGANSLLPGVIAARLSRQPGRRMVHVSSAAVHGTSRVLDERETVRPASAYGRSKLAGEELALVEGGSATEVIIYRPTSVQGSDRGVTAGIRRIARSPLSSVRGRGDEPTPQALVENVARVVRDLVVADEVPEGPVIHPWEGQTTASLLAGMGGRRPLRLPGVFVDGMLTVGYAAGRVHSGVLAQVRRLDMLWRGQAQTPGWLDAHSSGRARTWDSFFTEIAAPQDARGERPLTVGILSQWYDPEPGPASIPGVLARGLVAEGHTVRVVTGQPNYPVGRIYDGYRATRRTRTNIDGADVVRVPLFPSHDASMLRRVLNYGSFAVSGLVLGVRHLRRCDVVWVYNSPPTVLLPMWFVRYVLRRPVVLHVMDLWPESLRATGFAPQGRLSGAAYRLVDAVCRAMYRASSSVLFISPSVGEILEHRGVPAAKLAYVPVWTDETVFRAADDEIGTVRRGKDGVLTLLYAGALGHAQGLDRLVRAMGELRDVPVRLRVAGDGTERESLEALARDLGVSSVEFLGAVPKHDMPAVMRSADVHVISLLPTALGDVSLPSKLQATLAGAHPVLAIARGDLARVVAESHAGVVVDPEDEAGLVEAIASLADSADEALARMSRAAADYYEQQFAADTGIDRTVGALRTATEN